MGMTPEQITKKSSQGLAVEAVHHAWKERGDAMMRWDIPQRR